jgi:hypothetical protein
MIPLSNPPCQFGQTLFKLGEINEDEDSVAAYDSLRARNRSVSPAKSIGEKYCGSFVGSFLIQMVRENICRNSESFWR